MTTKEQTPLEAAKEWMLRTGCRSQEFKNAFSGPSAIIEALIGELERLGHWHLFVCSECHGVGEITVTSGQTPENFSQENIPCPYCIGPILDEHNKTLTAANARAERLREALEVYADENEWRGAGDREVWDLLFNSSRIDGDGWETARRALADDAKEGM